MFYFLSKTIDVFIKPVTWFLLLLIISLLVKNKTKRKRILFFTLAIIYLSSNQFIANELMLWWEIPPVTIASIQEEKPQTAVVLTGIVNNFKKPEDRVHISRGADRVLHPLQLYSEGVIEKIIIVGGYTTYDGITKKEADKLKNLLTVCGVNKEDIWTESESRNTYENAVKAKQIIQEKSLEGEVLLVTSAFHMRRAIACFEKQNIKVKAFSVDFYTSDNSYNLKSFLLPDVGALEKNTKLIREIVGFLVYKIRGYI